MNDSSGHTGDELLLPVGWGDFLDRLTIQELKAERLPDGESRDAAARQLARMHAILDEHGGIANRLRASLAELRAVNASLWVTESAVRQARLALDEYGRDKDIFRFCELARNILAGNERRAALKNAIDNAMGIAGENKHY